MTGLVCSVVLPFLAGLGLGLLHFGGLWLTVRHLTTVRQPWFCLVCSTVGRLGVSLMGFYLILQGGWQPLLVCLAGFVSLRLYLLRRWRALRPPLAPAEDVQHGYHAD